MLPEPLMRVAIRKEIQLCHSRRTLQRRFCRTRTRSAATSGKNRTPSTSCGRCAKGSRTWSFIDGPITANNPMGVHHGWGRTYKDIYNRYWSMRGRELRYQNGFDCQGLWVEVEVEKEFGFEIQEGHRELRPGSLRAALQGARARVFRRADRAIHPPGLLDGLERHRPIALAGRHAAGRIPTRSSPSMARKARSPTRSRMSSGGWACPKWAAATTPSPPKTTT